MLRLSLLIAALMLSACAASPPLLTPPTRPFLDSGLAAPCRTLKGPETADYDAWLAWMVDEVLPAYADCAIRHARTVEAWPK